MTGSDTRGREADEEPILLRLLARLPIARSLSGYQWTSLRCDLAAGATIGVMLIPQGMAYALIAGVPPAYGLYAALVPPIVYALLGTSRQLSVGPVAMDSLLVASAVAPLAGGDPSRYLTLAILLATLVGVVQLSLGLLRAGFLVNLLSRPVLAGFTSAAALVIGASQLGNLLGVASRVGDSVSAASIVPALSEIHPATLLVGGSGIVIGLLLTRWIPKLPTAMVLVTLGTGASWALGLEGRGVAVVGVVPGGLPGFDLPGLGIGEIRALLPYAVAIALVGFMEAIAVAKVYAARNRYDIDPDQELRALGSANIVGSLFQSFPVTGGFSRTAVNAHAGGRTQVAPLVGALVVAVTLLVLTPLFHHLPRAVLASVILLAIAGLVDWRNARELWRVDRRDFALMVATFGATLAFGITEGIVIGAVLSMASVLHQIARPQISLLGRIPGTNRFTSLARDPEAIREPGVAVIRMEASLFYGNAEVFRDRCREAFEATRGEGAHRALVIDAMPVNRTDSTGLQTLLALVEEIHRGGGRVYLAGVKPPLHDTLLRGGVVEAIGAAHIVPDLDEAVERARQSGNVASSKVS